LAVLVIAGSGRGAGKTAVGCALIAALPELRWVVVKVTPHDHDVDKGLWEELNLRSDKDTGRYLSAGAKRVFLISGVTDTQATELVAEARGRASECDALLVESNRIAAGAVSRRGERAVTVAVLSGPVAEWKASLRECAGSVDALVLSNGLLPDELESPFLRKPVFGLAEGGWSVPELVRFVRERIVG
jgi:molybdopterin-guanine dinucleotide biosynthesis protein